jgi:hypothetical protein
VLPQSSTDIRLRRALFRFKLERDYIFHWLSSPFLGCTIPTALRVRGNTIDSAAHVLFTVPVSRVTASPPLRPRGILLIIALAVAS